MSVRGKINVFDGTVTCARCTAKNERGERCKRSTCKYGPFCWQHMRIKRGLVIKPSKTGFGDGLFTIRPIREGTPIVEYKPGSERDVYTQNTANYMEQNPTKFGGKPGDEFQYANTQHPDRGSTVVNAHATNSTVGRYSNDCHGTGKTCNADFAQPREGGYPWIVATKDIPADAEILTSYGEGFWDQPSPTKQARATKLTKKLERHIQNTNRRRGPNRRRRRR